MIPRHLTHAEVGLFLQAVGRQMFERDLCFGAALDGNSHAAILEHLVGQLDAHSMSPIGDVRQRANQLLQLTGEEAISFVEGFEP